MSSTAKRLDVVRNEGFILLLNELFLEAQKAA
jgi:hypothetical protein